MTRWARSGNTQKHKKMPGNATPWKELSKDKINNNKDKLNTIKKGRIEKGKFKKSHEKVKKNKNFNLMNPKIQNNLFSMGNIIPPKQKINMIDLDSEDKPFISSLTGDVSHGQKQRVDNKEQLSDSDITELTVEKSTKKAKLQRKKQLKLGESHQNKKNDNDEISNHELLGLNSKINSTKSDPKLTKKQLRKAMKGNMSLVNATNLKESSGSVISSESSNMGSKLLSKSQLKKLKRKKKMQELKVASVTKSQMDTLNSLELKKPESVEGNQARDPTKLSKNQLKKARKRQKLLKRQQAELQGSLERADNPSVKGKTETAPIDCEKKKKHFLEKLQKRRPEKGIQSLPPKIEKKLFALRKRLSEKNVSPAVVKEVINKERRKEELKFRSTFSNKTCFNCRQTGHILEECPSRMENEKQNSKACFKCGSTDHDAVKCQKKIEGEYSAQLESSNQKFKTCYKCGSTDHMAAKCTKKIGGFPLASCFICKQQGHISRNCPQNTRGVYPKGGKCHLCGNINHLKKDCPTLKKTWKGEEEEDITLHTIQEGGSADAEVEVKQESKKMKSNKKARVVTF